MAGGETPAEAQQIKIAVVMPFAGHGQSAAESSGS